MRNYPPMPGCNDCRELGELCSVCGFMLYGIPENRGREGDCVCGCPGSAHLEFSGLCTECGCIEHEPIAPTPPTEREE